MHISHSAQSSHVMLLVTRRSGSRCLLALVLLCLWALPGAFAATGALAPADWADDLRPIEAADWNAVRAGHLLERAGFGARPEDVERALALGPRAAVARLVRPGGVADPAVVPFEPSDIPDAGIDPFPPGRPQATDMAKARGEALGVHVKPDGSRPLQPVVNKFFYWLRVSLLETQPRRLLVGEPHARHRAAAGGEDGAVLAWPLRNARGQGARSPQDASADRAVPAPGARAISAT